MHASHEGARDRKEPPRVILTQMVLSREGERAEILEATQRPRREAGLPEGLAIEGHARARPADRRAQPLELQRAPGVRRHRLRVAIPDHRTVTVRSSQDCRSRKRWIVSMRRGSEA